MAIGLVAGKILLWPWGANRRSIGSITAPIGTGAGSGATPESIPAFLGGGIPREILGLPLWGLSLPLRTLWHTHVGNPRGFRGVRRGGSLVGGGALSLQRAGVNPELSARRSLTARVCPS